jgi:hypothetical protein
VNPTSRIESAPSSTHPTGPSRREFLKTGALAGAALMLSDLTITAASSPGVRVIANVEGMDWSLPSWVRMAPNAGYFGGGEWVPKRRALLHFRDGSRHIAHYASFSWAEANPAEDVYHWEMIDEQVRAATSKPDEGFVFWIQNYGRYNYTRWKWAKSEQERQRILRETCMVPDWVLKRGKVPVLSNGAIAAWAPGCGYQKYFGKFLRALGARYKDHEGLLGVDMRGFDCRYGEWCWRDGAPVLKEAEDKTGLTPETLLAWGTQFVEDYLEAFRGREHKLIWPNADDTFISKRGTHYDYGPASRAIWQLAFSKGCGARDGEPTVWYRYITPGWGCSVTEDGYLLFDENYLPYRNHAMLYSENSEYSRSDDPERGPARLNGMRFFIGTLRVLQLRHAWEWIPWRVMDQIEGCLGPYGGEAFVRWSELELGKRADTSADAWCWLREGYRSRWAQFQPVKNIERWLLHRDIEPDGRTAPVEKVDISAIKFNYASGKGYEFHARRTDLAHGSRHVYFQVERHFLAGGPHHVQLKVTYVDGPQTTWRLEYSSPHGITQSAPLETTDTGTQRTVTFDVPDMQAAAGFRNRMDLRLTVVGQADLAVKFVRLVKVDPPPES